MYKRQIYNGANNQIRYPFIVEGGQVILSSAVIKDGFITNAMIGGYIQSNNYVWNQSGWHLGKDGTFLNFGSTPGEGSMKQDNQTISVRDQNGVLRVQIGRITGVW